MKKIIGLLLAAVLIAFVFITIVQVEKGKTAADATIKHADEVIAAYERSHR